MWKKADHGQVAGFIITDTDWCTTTAMWSDEISYNWKFKYSLIAFPPNKYATYDHYGDGGYLNWAIIGNFRKDGGHVTFY